MEIVETWYFQVWVNVGGMADKRKKKHKGFFATIFQFKQHICVAT